jgi:predicted Zn-dependent protease
MMLSVLGKKLSASEFARKVEESYGFSKLSGTPQTINGLSAYLGTYAGRKREIGEIKARIGSILVEDKGYTVIGIAPSSSFEEAMPFFASTINSFKRISFKEAKEIKPYKIRIYTVKEGDTWKSITHKLGLQPDEAQTLALINAFNPENLPKPGTRIKAISVGGN